MLVEPKISHAFYFAATGFGDVALHDAKNRALVGGGALKNQFKTAEVHHHPRRRGFTGKFVQNLNLNFTGYDSDLDHTFQVSWARARRTLARHKASISVDVGSLAGITKNQKAIFGDVASLGLGLARKDRGPDAGAERRTTRS